MSKKHPRPKGIPLVFTIIPKVYPVLEKYAPALANKLAVYLFLTPFVPKPKPKDLDFLQQADHHGRLAYQGQQLPYYQFGNGADVLLMHGWSSGPGTWRTLAKHLVEAGYKVHLLTGFGHAKQETSMSNMLLFGKVIQAYCQHQRLHLHAIIGHSLGGVAALYAITQLQLAVPRLVSIASPSIGQSILSIFMRKINSLKADQFIRDYALAHYGIPFDKVEGRELAKQLPAATQYLIVHSNDDLEAPIDSAHALKAAFPQADLMLCEGLGHNRIKNEDAVIHRIIQHLKQ